ncbi:MAG: hypothetical protein M0Q53_14840 [Prolixibacteraceae bacterium]|jgi:hypothetical protein|nr:hypothetical protein [Prolixibacteraceae bacterium]
MKKKILVLIGGMILTALMLININYANEDSGGDFSLSAIISSAIAWDGESGEGELCTSQTWCSLHYTTETVNGKDWCCSQNVVNEQGKAKL